MTDYNSLQLPPQSDWQAHERLCHALWMKLWNDPHTQMHGRLGQAQRGVDVFGTPHGESRPSGVQCKSKDRLIGTSITEKEIRKEVEEAKTFQPPLRELIIATSASADVEMQALAREITEAHSKGGLFSVHLYSWNEIVARLGAYPDLIDRFYGQHVPSGGVALNTETTARLEGWRLEARQGHADLKGMLSELTAAVARPADGPIHAQLDLCRELLEEHQYRAVLPKLERIREREWANADAALRFRIATNLAAAHLGRGAYAAAGELFLEAFQYDAASDKAHANRAIGLLLLERRPEALKAARDGVEQHSESARTWSALLTILPRVEPETPVPSPPPVVASHPDVLFTLGDALAMREAWTEAEATLRQLITLPAASPLAPSRLGEVLLAQTARHGRFYAGVQYSATEVARLREALALFQQSWRALKDTERAADALHVVQNHCAVCAIMGPLSDAEALLDEALMVAPAEPGLLSWKIRIAAARDDAEGARRAFALLPKDSVEEYALLEAATARLSQDLPRALSVLEAFIAKAEGSELAGDARCLFADLVAEVDLAHAESRFDALPASGADSAVRSTLIFARALYEQGEEARGRAYLSRAREHIGDRDDARLKLLLADTLAQFDEHAAAIEIYAKCVSPAADSTSLRNYARSLLEADQRQRLTQLLNAMPPALLEKPSYQYLRANFAVRIGDWQAAREHLERCLAQDPTSMSARLLWAQISIRLGEPAAVQDWLQTIDVRAKTWTLEQLLKLGPLFHALERREEAAAVFYQALRRFPHDHRSHLAFTGSVLFKGSDAWMPAPDAIITGEMACGLRDADGRERIFVLQDLPEKDLVGDEVSLTSPVGTRLLGRKVGEEVTFLASDLGSHASTVMWIKHKLIHALHESLADFNTRFPDVHSLIGFKLPTSGTAEEQLAPITQALEDKAAHAKRVFEAYRQGLPLALVGTAMGRGAIEAWRSLIGRAEEPVRVCLGNAAEREAAFTLLREQKGRFILEPTSLIELQALGALDAAEAVCGRFAIVQATVGELRSLIADLDLHTDGYKTIFERDGQKYWHEISAAEVAKERRLYEDLLAWIARKCEIVPAVPTTDLKPDQADALSTGLGDATYDTLLAAQGRALVLVSDDWHLRRLAKEALRIEGVWIQPILMQARVIDRLHPLDYNRAVIGLVNWKHHFTSVSTDQLQYAAVRGRWKVTPDFERLAATLDLQHCEPSSNFGVVWRFLEQIWRKGAGPSKREALALTNAILKGVNPGASPANESYFRGLAQLMQQGKLPRRAFEAVVEWYRGEGLAPAV